MSEHIMRVARPGECMVLTELRLEYVRHLYRGLVQEAELKSLDMPAMYDKLKERQNRPGWHVTVAEHNGVVDGYVCFGPDPEDPANGMIEDAATRPGCNGDVRYKIIENAVTTLTERGCKQISLWVLRDNLRARFTCENFGFRREGSIRNASYAGTGLQQIRYLLRVNRGPQYIREPYI